MAGECHSKKCPGRACRPGRDAGIDVYVQLNPVTRIAISRGNSLAHPTAADGMLTFAAGETGDGIADGAGSGDVVGGGRAGQ